jgi:hypothetical protein
MWKAKLLAVNYNADQETGKVVLSVELFHTDGRTTTRDYIIWVDELTSISLSSLRIQVDEDVARLGKIDSILSTLNDKVGQVL